MKSMIKVKRVAEVVLRLSEENETAHENPAGPQDLLAGEPPITDLFTKTRCSATLGLILAVLLT